MTNAPVRLLALDLDGTLVDHHFQFSPRVKRAIAQAQADGVTVTLATGRSLVSIRPFAQALDICGPLICYQGGLIVDCGGRVLHRSALERRLAAQVIDFAQARNWHVTVYRDGEFYLSEYRRPAEFYHTLLNPEAHVVDDLRALLDQDPDKVLVIANDGGDGDRILADLRARFDGQMAIFRSHELFVEANPPGVDKGAALAWVAQHLGVPQAQVMAVGDQDNDTPMVAWAGVGVAMGNASPACKAAADWIAPPFAQDGAATAIERFVLKQN